MAGDTSNLAIDVATIPELVRMILSYLENDTLASTARVCRQWYEVSLDILWWDVDECTDLFNLLVPIDNHEFTRIPFSEDYERFQRYARRIRYFSLQDVGPLDNMLSVVASTRLTTNIFPNMHTLDLHLSGTDNMLYLFIMFMQKNVRGLMLTLEPGYFKDDHRLYGFFRDIIFRMPNLTRLELHTQEEGVESFGTLMVTILLHGLSRLEFLVLRQNLLTFSAFEMVSRLRHLRFIKSSDEDEDEEEEEEADQDEDEDDPLEEPDNIPRLTTMPSPDIPFPNLSTMHVKKKYEDVAQLISSTLAPANLVALKVASPISEGPRHTLVLIQAIVDKIPNLKELSLYDEPGNGHITFKDIEPITHMSSLVTVRLEAGEALRLSQDEIEIMSLSWPSLECLSLSPCPSDFKSPTLTLSALIPLSRNCPKLRVLSLTLCAISLELPPASDLRPFKNLASLCVGVSNIDKPYPIAIFLNQILPPRCQVSYGDEDADREDLNQRRLRWEVVTDVLIDLRAEKVRKVTGINRSTDSLK